MERINQFDFYDLSRALQKLVALGSEAINASAALWPVWGAHVALSNLLELSKPTELGISRAKALGLQGRLDHLLDVYFMSTDATGSKHLSHPSEGAEIPSWEMSWVQKCLTEFETIFAEEMREAATYRVPNRGIYDTAKLADAAHSTFPAEIVGHVPQKTKEEWLAAGRCLAFGLFTASGFHVARAVEGTLEGYFHHFNGGPDKKLKAWGDYLNALEKISADSAKLTPDSKTIGELKQMKDDWRNPLMHPRVGLNETDARAVFNNGETLIMMMAQELARASEQAQPTLALVSTDAGVG